MAAVHDGVEAAPFVALRSRVTSTVGLCLPAVLGVASTSVSGGFARVALPRRGRARSAACPGRPFFSGPGADETDPHFVARLVSPRRTKRFPLRAPFVANRLPSCCQPFERQPEPPCRPRTTSPSWEPRAPSAAESRTSRTTSPPPARSSRHSYAGFATSAELPTCLHAMRIALGPRAARRLRREMRGPHAAHRLLPIMTIHEHTRGRSQPLLRGWPATFSRVTHSCR
jgi:hypothetical protein